MVHRSRACRFVLSLVSAALVYFSMAATVTDAAEGPLVPVRYIITKSDKYSGDDTDPDLTCTPQDNLTVSCLGRDGRLFDMVDSSKSTNMKWKISHHWLSSERREIVHVELVFSCPVTISAMTWHFFQDSVAHVPSNSNWSVIAIAPNGTDNTSQFIKAMPTSQGEAFKLSMSNISGFPASTHWRIIIPLPSPRNWLFLNELNILGEAVNRIVPQSYSITKSDQFYNINPDDKATGCTTVDETTNCSTPGRLFDGVKPGTANNASLFHLWQMKSDSVVQLMFMFQEPVIIEKLVWTFYYNTEAQHETLRIPAANITQWSLTAINMTDLIVTSRTVHNLLVYTMVVQGSMAAQRWGSTFSAPAAPKNQWLLLSEVEVFGTNAVDPTSPVDPTSLVEPSSPVEPLSPSPSSTTTSTVVTRGLDMSTPATMESPNSDGNPDNSSDPSSLIPVIAGLASVICLLILCVLVVILALALKICQARRHSQNDSGKGTPGPEAVYSEIPNSYGMPPVDLSKLPGQSYVEQPPVIDYANNATILKQAISGRVSPVYDEPEKYRIGDLSRSMPMIARLTAAQNWTADRHRCRTESPTVWNRDSDATGSVGSLSSLPPGFANNAFSASPSTGQENGYHELVPSDGEDEVHSTSPSLVNAEHKYATLEHVTFEDDEDTESTSEGSTSPTPCETGVDPPTGVREPPYAKPQKKKPSPSDADDTPPAHTCSLVDRSSWTALPLGEEPLEASAVAEGCEDPSAA